MPYFFISPLEKTFEPSSIAARAQGPKARMPASVILSTIPSAKGSSGATKTRSAEMSFAAEIIESMSVAFIGRHSAMSAIPALPGAQ